MPHYVAGMMRGLPEPATIADNTALRDLLRRAERASLRPLPDRPRAFVITPAQRNALFRLWQEAGSRAVAAVYPQDGGPPDMLLYGIPCRTETLRAESPAEQRNRWGHLVDADGEHIEARCGCTEGPF